MSIFSLIALFKINGMGTSKCANCFRIIAWTIFQTECACALLVDLTFWGILVPSSDNPAGAVNYLSVSMHFINMIFLMTELFLNELRFKFHYGVFVLMAGMTYLIWSWIYYDLEGCKVVWNMLRCNVRCEAGYAAADDLLCVGGNWLGSPVGTGRDGVCLSSTRDPGMRPPRFPGPQNSFYCCQNAFRFVSRGCWTGLK